VPANPTPSRASHDLSFHLELGFTIYEMSQQEVFDERVTFLKEKNNPKNKSEVNDTFRLQAHALRFADIEKDESNILQKMAILKNCKDVHKSNRLFAELDAIEWLQRQVARHY
jgi:hypothetical protein